MILSTQSLNIEGLSSAQNAEVEARIMQVIREWEGTPYGAGQKCKGVAVDCVRFVSSVLDELTGKSHDLDRLPQDASFHNKELVGAGLRSFLTMYPSDILPEGVPSEPGDVIVMGPRNGGPGHAAIVGKGAYWHCGPDRVCMGGLGFPDNGGVYTFKHIRRLRDRNNWLITK